MRDENGVDAGAVDRELVQRHEGGRAAIDVDIDAVADEMKAGIKAPAGAKGVAATDELKVHVRADEGATRDLLMRRSPSREVGGLSLTTPRSGHGDRFRGGLILSQPVVVSLIFYFSFVHYAAGSGALRIPAGEIPRGAP